MVRIILSFSRLGAGDWLGPGVFMVLFGTMTYFQPIFLLWYVAIYTSFRLIFRLRVYTEHLGTDGTLPTVVPPLWKRWIYLPNNTWCHAEHHENPNTPFSKLKKD
jgi:hypothetical protein